jgi:hypothetical protein
MPAPPDLEIRYSRGIALSAVGLFLVCCCLALYGTWQFGSGLSLLWFVLFGIVAVGSVLEKLRKRMCRRKSLHAFRFRTIRF